MDNTTRRLQDRLLAVGFGTGANGGVVAPDPPVAVGVLSGVGRTAGSNP
jgi:hypothetical protein